jgi:8-oxo-dGTP diphosphatase
VVLGVTLTLLTQRADDNSWCLPGGLVEPYESVEEALHREVMEEVNLRVRILSFVGVYSANNLRTGTVRRQNSIILAFRCEAKKGTPSLSNEVVAVRFFSLSSLPKSMIPTQTPRIYDAANRRKSVVA